MQQFLVAGLGNPGKQYENTRHNAGFLAVDLFARTHDFPEFLEHKKSQSLISEGEVAEYKVLLAKPQTSMNNSGKAVVSLAAFLPKASSLKPALGKNIIVVHDDIDIPLGEIRIAEGRGSAGHKGVESVIQHLKTKDFTRIRIGILPQEGKPENVEEFVLQKFSEEELPLLSGALTQAVLSLENFLQER